MEKTTVIINETGFHIRPVTLLVKEASAYQASLRIISPLGEADAKSMFELMALGLTKGTEITVRGEGPDAEEGVNALVKLIETGFGE